MIKEIIFTVTESLDGGYEAKALGHSIYTQCDDYNELPAILRDAVKCHFNTDEWPSLIRIRLIRILLKTFVFLTGWILMSFIINCKNSYIIAEIK